MRTLCKSEFCNKPQKCNLHSLGPLTLVVLTLLPVLQDQPVRSGRTLHSSPSKHGCIWHHHFCSTMEAEKEMGKMKYWTTHNIVIFRVSPTVCITEHCFSKVTNLNGVSALNEQRIFCVVKTSKRLIKIKKMIF